MVAAIEMKGRKQEGFNENEYKIERVVSGRRKEKSLET